MLNRETVWRVSSQKQGQSASLSNETACCWLSWNLKFPPPPLNHRNTFYYLFSCLEFTVWVINSPTSVALLVCPQGLLWATLQRREIERNWLQAERAKHGWPHFIRNYFLGNSFHGAKGKHLISLESDVPNDFMTSWQTLPLQGPSTLWHCDIED